MLCENRDDVCPHQLVQDDLHSSLYLPRYLLIASHTFTIASKGHNITLEPNSMAAAVKAIMPPDGCDVNMGRHVWGKVASES
jgi:hypothetical protein